MKIKNLALLGAVGSVIAQRPSSVSICDYYTTALLKQDTPTNQYTLLTLLVNTVVIGNYTQPNVGVTLPGILAPATYLGEAVNLLPYFNGCFKSTNVNNVPSYVNFLDGGGAAALMQNLPAFSSSSNQFGLLTHLYQFFGVLLGCSGYAKMGFPPYGGDPEMYNVHKFMSLDPSEVGYFISQVGLAAASFGVASSDISIVANALVSYFDYRCTTPVTIVPGAGALRQEICGDPTCPVAPTPECWYYPNSGIEPAPQTAASCQSSASTYTTSSTYAKSSTYSSSLSTLYTSTKVYSTTTTSSSTSQKSGYSLTTSKYK